MLKKEKAATKFSKVSFREMAMQSNRLQKKEMKTLLLEGPMMNDDSWEGCSFILRMNVVARRIDFCLRYPCLFRQDVRIIGLSVSRPDVSGV